MEIQCPRCQAVMQAGQPGRPVPCPQCGAFLEMEVEEEGLALVSAGEPDQGSGPIPLGPCCAGGGAAPQEPLDPILEDHSKWKAGSVFAIVCGVAGLICLAMVGFADYSKYGWNHLWRGSYPWVLGCTTTFCLLAIIAGAVMFVVVGRENRRYRQHLSQKAAHRGA